MHIRVANAPVSWGVLEFDDMIGGGGPWHQVLDEMAETGYVGTELGDFGYLPTDPPHLIAELSSRGLAMLGAFIPVELRNPDAIAPACTLAVEVATLLAAVATPESAPGPFIVLSDDNGCDPVRTANAGRVCPEMHLTPAEWQHLVTNAEVFARTVRDATGLRTVFHHHSAGFVETPAEIDEFLDATDPTLIGLVFDTGHFVYGAGTDHSDPADFIRAHRDRIWHVHFKDCHPAVAAEARTTELDYFEALRRGVFCELGRGEVDFPEVLAALQEIGYDGWIVVEQDVLPGMGTPRESALRNREYLRAIGL